MNRPSLAARLTCASLLFATSLLAACGDDGDGGDAAGGSATDSPLSGLLSGFGTPGASNPTRPVADAGAGGASGAGGAEVASDAGIVEPVMPVQPVSDNCSKVCARIPDCLPKAGCDNFDRLPREVQEATVADCESKCEDISDEAFDVINRLSCEAFTAEVLKEPGIAAFCALVPASEGDCRQFCRQLRDCGVPVTDEQCDTACLYSPDGVACINEHACEPDACNQYFP